MKDGALHKLQERFYGSLYADIWHYIECQEEEIYRLNHANNYLNELSHDLLKEIEGLKVKVSEAESVAWVGRHRKP